MKRKKISIDEILAKRQGSIHTAGSGDLVVKGFRSPATWNSEERTARYTMSAQAPDRDGDTVRAAGIKLDEFIKNPQGLVFHASRSWPVGLWEDLEKVTVGRTPRLDGTIRFAPKGVIEEADKAAGLVACGILRACSIGFRPLEAEGMFDDNGRFLGIDFQETELLECSLVPIPAHPKALVKSAGGDLSIAREFLEEAIENYAITPEGLLVPRSEYEKQYRVIVEKIGAARPNKDKDPKQLAVRFYSGNETNDAEDTDDSIVPNDVMKVLEADLAAAVSELNLKEGEPLPELPEGILDEVVRSSITIEPEIKDGSLQFAVDTDGLLKKAGAKIREFLKSRGKEQPRSEPKIVPEKETIPGSKAKVLAALKFAKAKAAAAHVD